MFHFMPTIAIIGASRDRSKFSNKALRQYAKQGYQVYPVHPKDTEIEGFPAFRSILDIPVPKLDRVSVYLPPEIGMKVIDDIAKKKVVELWLNPGADSPELIAKAELLGLNVIAACSMMAAGGDPDR